MKNPRQYLPTQNGICMKIKITRETTLHGGKVVKVGEIHDVDKSVFVTLKSQNQAVEYVEPAKPAKPNTAESTGTASETGNTTAPASGVESGSAAEQPAPEKKRSRKKAS